MWSIVVDAAFAALCLVVAVETIVLLDALRLTVRLEAEVYDAMPGQTEHDRLAGGTLVEFEAPDVATGAPLRSGDLRGAAAALLFVAPGEREGYAADWLLDTVSGLGHKADGRVLVLCDGDSTACSGLSRIVGPAVPVLLDEGGRIRGRFLVTVTPAAVVLDSDARVAQYGMPEHVPDREKEVV